MSTSLVNMSFVPFDVVIKGGRVMDPQTEFDQVCNVGIADGKIVSITDKDISGKKTIDAKGLVVCPGFIDGHVHGTDPFSYKVIVRDGVTTAMDMEAGIHDAANWYASQEGKVQLNYGHVACAGMARIAVLDGQDIAALGRDMYGMTSKMFPACGKRAVEEGRGMGWNATLPDKKQMTQIMALLDENLRQGCLGIGVPVGYMTHGVNAYEMFKYQELAGKWGRLTNSHARFAGVMPPDSGALGIQELMSNAMVLGSPLMVAHTNSVMDWEFTDSYVAMARQRGHKIWSESYPYHAGSTIASTDILSKQGMESMGIT